MSCYVNSIGIEIDFACFITQVQPTSTQHNLTDAFSHHINFPIKHCLQWLHAVSKTDTEKYLDATIIHLIGYFSQNTGQWAIFAKIL